LHPEQLQSISERLKELEVPGPENDVEEILRAIDVELQKCKSRARELGLLDQEVIDTIDDSEINYLDEIEREAPKAFKLQNLYRLISDL
jgi:hypothetical protein